MAERPAHGKPTAAATKPALHRLLALNRLCRIACASWRVEAAPFYRAQLSRALASGTLSRCAPRLSGSRIQGRNHTRKARSGRRGLRAHFAPTALRKPQLCHRLSFARPCLGRCGSASCAAPSKRRRSTGCSRCVLHVVCVTAWRMVHSVWLLHLWNRWPVVLCSCSDGAAFRRASLACAPCIVACSLQPPT